MAGTTPPSPEDFALSRVPTPESVAALSNPEPAAAPAPTATDEVPAPTLPTGETIAPQPITAVEAESGSRPATVAITPSVDDWLGRTIAGYEIIAKLGQGGMGVVYKGRQVSLDRTVAIKVLSKALSENQEFIKRFEREAKSIARINHPNIVAVYDFGRFEGTWFMVSEFVEGIPLSNKISEQVMLTVEEVQPILEQCLAALASVAAMGVVHRDIKPDNIIITRDGIAKLLDFGLAKDVSAVGDATDLTGAGLAMGTPAYMSPEQCMGRKLDGRSDIYALGITAYFALTGEKPFVGHSSFEIMTRQRELVPPAPHVLNPRLPVEVSDIIMKMLAKNPLDRYSDAETCRLAWEDLRHRMAATGSAAIGRDAAVSRTSLRTAQPMFPDLVVSPVPLPAGPTAPATNAAPPASSAAAAPAAAGASAAGASARAARVDGPRRPADNDDRSARSSGSGSEWTLKPPGDSRRSKGEPAPCPKCGHLNRGDTATCMRCRTVLRIGEPPSKDLLPEAERLLEQGAFSEAASIFARLADAENDRRLRSVLRSKEREARRCASERHDHEMLARARGLADRGDLRGALAAISDIQSKQPRDPSVSTVSGIDQAAGEFRSRLSQRRRRMTALLVSVVIILVLVGVAVWAKLQGVM